MKKIIIEAYALIEVLVSIFLLSLLSLVFMRVLISQSKIAHINELKMEMNYLAQSIIERNYSNSSQYLYNDDFNEDFDISYTESQVGNSTRMKVTVYSKEIDSEVSYVLYK